MANHAGDLACHRGDRLVEMAMRVPDLRLVLLAIVLGWCWTPTSVWAWSASCHRLVVAEAWRAMGRREAVPAALLAGAVAPDRQGRHGAIPIQGHVWDPMTRRGLGPVVVAELWDRLRLGSDETKELADPALLFEMGRLSHVAADLCQPMHAGHHEGEKRWHARWERSLDRRLLAGRDLGFLPDGGAATVREGPGAPESAPHDRGEPDIEPRSARAAGNLARRMARRARARLEALMKALEAGDTIGADEMARLGLGDAVAFTRLLWTTALRGGEAPMDMPWELLLMLLWGVNAWTAPPRAEQEAA